MKNNQRGITFITLIIALVIVCIMTIVSVKLMNKSFKAATGKDSKATVKEQSDTLKKDAIGAVCRESITAIQKMVDNYQLSNNAPPGSLDELAEASPEVKGMINDTSTWASGGGPKIESSSDGYTITGFCNDGNKYVYNSTGGMTAAPSR
jgi:competence protein ComGC